MIELTYQQIQDKIDNNQNPNVQEVWNAAVEAAAKLAESSKGYPTPISERIRELKK